MRAFVSGIMACAVALGSTAALAEPMSEQDHPWQEGHERYEFRHPLNATCHEFVESAEVYQPFVVAWLSGYRHHEQNVAAAEEEFVPISVPHVVEQCTGHPDMHVRDVVNSIMQEREHSPGSHRPS